MSDEQDFYAGTPVFDNFADAVRQSNYRPLPDDWVIGFSDVVGSTKAIKEGRYKAVNMVGAGVIASVANALGRKPFPYVFGGDGASFAISAADAPLAAEALSSMAVFAREELGIELRVATATITAVARPVAMCWSRATPLLPIAPTRCLPAAGSPGWRPRSNGARSSAPAQPDRARTFQTFPAGGRSPRRRMEPSFPSLSYRVGRIRVSQRWSKRSCACRLGRRTGDGRSRSPALGRAGRQIHRARDRRFGGQVARRLAGRAARGVRQISARLHFPYVQAEGRLIPLRDRLRQRRGGQRRLPGVSTMACG